MKKPLDILLITNETNESLYSKLTVRSRTSLMGVDNFGDRLMTITPEYIRDMHPMKWCCGLRFPVVIFDTDEISQQNFTYFLSRNRRATYESSIVNYDYPVMFLSDKIRIDGVDYRFPSERSPELLLELYETLSGDRSVLDLLETT